MKSVFYLYIRGWIRDFNESSSKPKRALSPLSVFSRLITMLHQQVTLTSALSSWPRRFYWLRALLSERAAQETSSLPFVSWLAQLSPNSPNASPAFISLLILSFCFCCRSEDSRRSGTSTRDPHNVPVIRLISGPPNAAGSHGLMSCAWHSWLVWLPFVCLCFYYPAAADRFHLQLFPVLFCYCGRRWFFINHTGVLPLCGPSTAQHGLCVSWGC